MNVAVRHEAVRVAQALRAAEHGIALIANAIDEQAIFMIALDGTVVSWNDGGERLEGYAADEIVGTSCDRLLAPDAESPACDDIFAIVRSEGRFRREAWRIRKDGTRYFGHLTVRPVHDDEAGVIGFAGIIRDISRRMAGQLRTAESERLHRLLTENASDVIARIDLNGVRLYVSPACRRVYGYEPEELVGVTPLALVHPDDCARVEAGVGALLATDGDTVLRFRQRHRDGHYLWLETSYRLVRDAETNAPVEFVTVARDISRHRALEVDAAEAEARLEENVRLLKLAESVAQLGHWRLDARDGTIFWSDEVFRIHGLMPGAMPDAATALAAYHPADQAMVSDVVATALREGTPFSCRSRLVRPDGTMAHVASAGQAIRAPDGTVLGLFGTFQDITEHVATEERLQEHVRLLEMAGRVAKLGHWRINLRNGKLTWSDEVFRIHGLEPGGVPDGAAAFATYHPDDQMMVGQKVATALRDGSAFSFRARVSRPDGTIAHVSTHGQVIRAADGMAHSVFGTFQDISEHVATEARTREHVRLLEMAERVAQLGHWRLDLRNGKMHWSDEVFRIHGLEPGGVPDAAAAFASYHPDDQATIAPAMVVAVRDGTPYSYRARLSRPDGTIAHVSSHGQAIRDADGTVIGLFGTFQDISEHVATEARLQDNVRLLEMAGHVANLGHWRLNLRNGALFWSDEVFRLHGLEPGPPPDGAAAFAAYHPDDQKIMGEKVGAALRDGSTFSCRGRLLRPDGTVAHVLTYGQVLRHSDGTAHSIFGTFQDVSEHVAIEARLQENIRLLEMAEQAAHVGYWRLDLRKGKMYWSDEKCRIHGFEPGHEPDMDSGFGTFHPADQAVVGKVLTTALRDGAPFSYRARLTRPDGTIAHVTSNGQALRGPDGKMRALFGTFQDISEHVAAEARLTAALEEARVAERAKADFLATMSHEIRTPMTGLMGMIELLRSEPEARAREALFASLERSTRTLKRILDDVLDYSKIQAHELPIHPAPFDLRASVEAGIELFRQAARAKGLDLTLDFPSGPTQVFGDGERLQQILFNLLGNAIKFTAQGGIAVRVTPPAQGEHWTMSVCDTGLGLPADADIVLFRPFVQGDPTIARRFGGTGLGLAISRTLAEAMGGSLHARPVVGPGSCLQLILPLPAASDAVAIDVRPAAPVTPRHILVAEDHPANRLLLETWLTRQGHEVHCVDDGPGAVAAAAAQAFDVILMDRQMPGLDGLTASAAIRDLRGAAALTPIILLSADVLSDMKEEKRAVGIVERLAKPIDFARLAQCLAALPGCDATPHEVIDPVPVAALLEQFGAAATNRLLAMVEEELSAAPDRIIGVLRTGDFVAAYELAHRSIGALANVGATALVAALRRVRRDMTEIDAGRAITAIASAAAATRRQLDMVVRLEKVGA